MHFDEKEFKLNGIFSIIINCANEDETENDLHVDQREKNVGRWF